MKYLIVANQRKNPIALRILRGGEVLRLRPLESSLLSPTDVMPESGFVLDANVKAGLVGVSFKELSSRDAETLKNQMASEYEKSLKGVDEEAEKAAEAQRKADEEAAKKKAAEEAAAAKKAEDDAKAAKKKADDEKAAAEKKKKDEADALAAKKKAEEEAAAKAKKEADELAAKAAETKPSDEAEKSE